MSASPVPVESPAAKPEETKKESEIRHAPCWLFCSPSRS